MRFAALPAFKLIKPCMLASLQLRVLCAVLFQLGPAQLHGR